MEKWLVEIIQEKNCLPGDSDMRSCAGSDNMLRFDNQNFPKA